MNKPLSDADLATPTVTTGPIAGSRKVYAAPDAAPELRVPLREIPLAEGSGEEPVRVYDPVRHLYRGRRGDRRREGA